MSDEPLSDCPLCAAVAPRQCATHGWIGSDSREPFILYQMADGSGIGEYEFVTDTEWWDDRDEEVRLIKRTYRLIAEEEIVLPAPFPIDDDDQ